jgi:hypothetical protein
MPGPSVFGPAIVNPEANTAAGIGAAEYFRVGGRVDNLAIAPTVEFNFSPGDARLTLINLNRIIDSNPVFRSFCRAICA